MKTKFEVRVPYQYDEKKVSDENGLQCKDKSRTSQEFKEEVDINTIAHRYGLTGELPVDLRWVTQGDFTNVFDYRSAMDLLVAAREAFDAQPAHVRSRFDNDPHKFLEFTSNAENLDEAIKLGLVREESVTRRATELKAARKREIDAAVAVELAVRAKAAAEPPVLPAKPSVDQSST